MKNDFCVFILCYGRPDNCDTLNTLRKANYTGKYYLVLSTDDSTISRYIDNFGEEHILIFDKNKLDFDCMDTFGNKKCVVYARNVCFELAKQVGVRYFLELDDDYTKLRFRFERNGKLASRYCIDADELFSVMLDLLNSSDKIYSVALAQTGDYIGGLGSAMLSGSGKSVRKCMNSFFCDVTKRFDFAGTFNEDVNTYTALQSKGPVFLTVQHASVNQRDTQQTTGGMVDIYNTFGTYVKSFYSVMCCPSAVKICMMGDTHYRMHHRVSWNNCVPKIISDYYKKK